MRADLEHVGAAAFCLEPHDLAAAKLSISLPRGGKGLSSGRDGAGASTPGAGKERRARRAVAA